jgi:hypothetical protein
MRNRQHREIYLPPLNRHGELALVVEGGQQLCCGQKEDGTHGDYLCLRDRDGNEIMMWDSEELAEDPNALGAAFNMALTPLAGLLRELGRNKVVDGCWVPA